MSAADPAAVQLHLGRIQSLELAAAVEVYPEQTEDIGQQCHSGLDMLEGQEWV